MPRGRDPEDLSGRRFSHLTVVRLFGRKPVRWECLCRCGQLHVVDARKLNNGHTRSCGCATAQMIADSKTVHGQRRRTNAGARVTSKLYTTWSGMIDRCCRSNSKAYHRYGGRGICVCQRWRESFENFRDDVGEPPSRHHSLDRIDNDGDYCPENCRWATQVEQCNNTSRCLAVDFGGRSWTIAELARHTGMEYNVLYRRIRRVGMRPKDAVSKASG